MIIGMLSVCSVARANEVTKTSKAGPYRVTLKVLQAESFTGPRAVMVRDGGDEPNEVGGKEHPNHHLVVFVREKTNPVEDARVSIQFRTVGEKGGHKRGPWMTLPVVRMHEAGKGLETTHYGNNVFLAGGKYEARVAVNDQEPVRFRFMLEP